MHAQTGFVSQEHYAQGNTKKWVGGTAAVQRVTLAIMCGGHSLQSKVDPRSKPAYGGWTAVAQNMEMIGQALGVRFVTSL